MAESDRDKQRREQRRFMSWPQAIALWIVVSFVGWLMIVGLLLQLGTGDMDQIADDEPKGEVEVAPAAGPDQRPAQ